MLANVFIPAPSAVWYQKSYINPLSYRAGNLALKQDNISILYANQERTVLLILLGVKFWPQSYSIVWLFPWRFWIAINICLDHAWIRFHLFATIICIQNYGMLRIPLSLFLLTLLSFPPICYAHSTFKQLFYQT